MRVKTQDEWIYYTFVENRTDLAIEIGVGTRALLLSMELMWVAEGMKVPRDEDYEYSTGIRLN